MGLADILKIYYGILFLLIMLSLMIFIHFSDDDEGDEWIAATLLMMLFLPIPILGCVIFVAIWFEFLKEKLKGKDKNARPEQ